MDLPDQCVDFVVTDPPFFDNVHYSELADFFYAWQQLSDGASCRSTRHPGEVQDADARSFTKKLTQVLLECHRVLKDEGLLVFTYHHSRDEGWKALAEAVLGSGFVFINAHPVRAEMSVAAPKSQAKDPIQLDMILICRKRTPDCRPRELDGVRQTIEAKIYRLIEAGFRLSRNDVKIIALGQALTTLTDPTEFERWSPYLGAIVAESAQSAFVAQDGSPRKLGCEALPLFERLAGGN